MDKSQANNDNSDSQQQPNSEQAPEPNPPPQSQPPQTHLPPSTPSKPPRSQRHRSHEHIKTDRLYTPQLKFTNFSAQAPIVTKYVTSRFLRHDVSYFKREAEQEGSKVIVIHPGSRYLRIGHAYEAFPYVVPHVIARKIKVESQDEKDKMSIDINKEENERDDEDAKESHAKENDESMNEDVDPKSESPGNWSGSAGSSGAAEEIEEEDEEQFKNVVNEIKKELKDRMKNSKRRPVANAQTQVFSFNKASHPETIADHNDPYKVDWTVIDEDAEYYVGEKALRLSDPENTFKLFYPIQHGEFNSRDYNSIKAVVGDLETIWTETIREKLGISPKKF
ncbi:16245_t:CDS:2 [Acaulospora morrowiae]|uniref:16245_t:CDS:1 n=1 Tax=Acaulospora morrowiae TaxID=94023 RepID=A0A9N8V1R8_9GLOM|nr:16245_t:CDS:2 [Acaulospora morrowiae]